MCAGGGDRLSTFIPVLLPPSSITPLIFPSPPPQSCRNLQPLLSAAHQTGLLFYAGLCETFSGISNWWGCISPFFLVIYIYLSIFNIFHDAFWAGASATTGLGSFPPSSWLLPSILLASPLHPLGCTHGVALVLLLPLFAFQFPSGS